MLSNHLLLVIYIVIALFFSFMCSIMEAVLLSIPSHYVQLISEQYPAVYVMLRRLKNDVNAPLTAILTLNTVAHTMGAAGVGAEVMALYGSHYLTISSIILTILILFLSEIIPKTLGTSYWRQLVPYIIPMIYYLTLCFKPFISLTKKITYSSTILDKKRVSFAREELIAAKDMAMQEGVIDYDEYLIMDNLLSLNVKTVDEILTPRVVIQSFNKNMTIEQYFIGYQDQPFSRIPIYDDDKDNIIGFVLKRDLLLAQARGEGNKTVGQYTRDILIILNRTSVLKAMSVLIKRRSQISLVVDEYGVYKGVMTMEDIMEELIGREIIDEQDISHDFTAINPSKG